MQWNFPSMAMLASGCLLVSCATSDYVATGVSDAWLDTPVRKADGPRLPQSTLSSWQTGLPKAEYVSQLRQQEERRREHARQVELAELGSRQGVVSTVRARYDDAPVYGVPGYRVGERYFRRGKRGHRNRGNAQVSFERTVEKVGPSIVPQPPVPLSTRSYTGGPRLLPREGVPVVPAAPLKKQGEQR